MSRTYSVSIRLFPSPGLLFFTSTASQWLATCSLTWFLLQLLTLCTVSLHAAWLTHWEKPVQTLASDKMQVLSLNEPYSFLVVKFRVSSQHFSDWADKKNCRENWRETVKIKILCSIFPCWEGHANSSQGDLMGHGFCKYIPVFPVLQFKTSLLCFVTGTLFL